MKKYLRTCAAPILLIMLLAASVAPGRAQENKPGKKRWILSAVALVAASAIDAHSSQGRMEMNPLLRGPNGTFSSRRAFAIKSAASGGMLLLQAILIKRNPDRNLYKPFAVTNTVLAGITLGTSVRNYRTAPVQQISPTPAPAPAYLLREGLN